MCLDLGFPWPSPPTKTAAAIACARHHSLQSRTRVSDARLQRRQLKAKKLERLVLNRLPVGLGLNKRDSPKSTPETHRETEQPVPTKLPEEPLE